MSWNFLVTARRPPPSATVMNVKKHARPITMSARVQPNSQELVHTNGGEEELIERNALQRGKHRRALRDGESAVQKPEPLVLDRRHQETVGHETCEALEVKGRGELLGVGDEFA